MKKCIIFFFSGTGNTYLVARRLAGELNARGLDASIAAIDAMNLSDIEWQAKASDILGFGFPVYGTRLPDSCAQFLKILPELKNEKRCFAFTTQPYALADAVDDIAAAIGERGYRVRQRAHFATPHNAPFVYNAVSVEEQRAMVDGLERPINALADAVADDKEYAGHAPVEHRRFLACRLDRNYARFKTRLSASDACSKCGFCAANCPMRNITLGDSVTFADKCCACMRCINFCPENAVQYRGKASKSPQYRGPYDEFSISEIYKKH